MNNDDVWVVVPTYNESMVVRGVLEALLEKFANVVAVNDCSTDTSATEIEASGARLVSHAINMGAGGALQTGTDFALLDPATQYVVFFDADGQHRVEDALTMVERMRAGDVDVLLGSRFLGTTIDMKASRRALLRAARWFEWMSTGIALTDAHNGLRVFNRQFAEILQMKMTDMAWASEFLSRVATSGMRWEEVPVTVEYTDYSRTKGQHSINSVNIGIDVLMDRFLKGHV